MVGWFRIDGVGDQLLEQFHLMNVEEFIGKGNWMHGVVKLVSLTSLRISLLDVDNKTAGSYRIACLLKTDY